MTANGATLTWDDSDYALLWAICKDGNVIAFATKPTFTVSEDGSYTVRAANEMGGLSEASEAVTVTATGIHDIDNGRLPIVDGVYDLQGHRVANNLEQAHLRPGIYICNGHKVVIK